MLKKLKYKLYKVLFCNPFYDCLVQKVSETEILLVSFTHFLRRWNALCAYEVPTKADEKYLLRTRRTLSGSVPIIKG